LDPLVELVETTNPPVEHVGCDLLVQVRE